MKLNEVYQSSGNTIYDLSLNSISRPDDDNIGKFRHGSHRKPVISLRHINKLKKIVAAKREEFNARQELMTVMYGIGEEDQAEF